MRKIIHNELRVILVILSIILISIGVIKWLVSSSISYESKVNTANTPEVFKNRLDKSQQFEMINQYRVENQLKPFIESLELCEIAEKRADFFFDKDMKNWFEAENTKDPHLGIWNFRKLYSGKAMGENIGAFARNDEENINGWKISPTHNANLLAKGWNNVEVDSACLAIRESPLHNVVILLVGDK